MSLRNDLLWPHRGNAERWPATATETASTLAEMLNLKMDFVCA